MLNALSILIGLISLVIVLPAQIPLLGALNWIALPIVVVGAVLGALSRKNTGRNLCLIVFVVAVVRLSLGGGLV
ncbi:MAG: hypothetical protein KDE15_11955 [Erythrobacter sp.]|nr:hypothetical protein [Erythrobacter sp.]